MEETDENENSFVIIKNKNYKKKCKISKNITFTNVNRPHIIG